MSTLSEASSTPLGEAMSTLCEPSSTPGQSHEHLQRSQQHPQRSQQHPLGEATSTLCEASGTPGRSRSSGVHSDTNRAGDTGAAESAIAVRILRQILLMVFLGVVELGRGKDF